MSATMKGGANLRSFLASLPVDLERNVLRGGLKAGADVVAGDARDRCRSDEVRATIRTASRTEPGLVTAKVQTKGEGAFKAPWLENGTDPHFISVDAEQSGGKTVRRINREQKKGTLVINGVPVGTTVHHPGARPFPFMRPALDELEQEAIVAIGAYVDKRLTREGLKTSPPAEPEE